MSTHKKIIGLFILICFCATLGGAFALPLYKADTPAKALCIEYLQSLYQYYINKDIYLQCKVVPWYPGKYLLYDDDGMFVIRMLGNAKDFNPRAGNDIIVKVKVLSIKSEDYVQLIEGKVIAPAAKK